MTEFLLLCVACGVGFVIFKNIKANSKQAKANRAAGEAFLLQNAANPEVTTTSSGLQHNVLCEGSGSEKPTASDRVTVHYHGTLIDGRVFDSSVERDEPITFGLNQVIKGWSEGVQLMVVGEKRRLVIPADLAYGNGSAGIITPGSVLIFDIELLAISA